MQPSNQLCQGALAATTATNQSNTPTGMDAETERKVIENLSRRGCTQVVVAHRLSTIRDADLILVLDKGQVVQRGRHQSMIQDPDSPYAQLLRESA